MQKPDLQQFYISQEQSIYLLNHADAEKLRSWIELCHQQLQQLGYRQTEYIGKGAYGFAFAAISAHNEHYVFKFSRITLPQHVQDRLEEEAFMLEQVDDPLVPKCLGYFKIGKQRILAMERSTGIDLEQYSIKHGPLAAKTLINIAAQMCELLLKLRSLPKSIIHGDIKPSNIVFNHATNQIGLIDWGSSVYAQLDSHGQFVSTNVMALMSGDLQHSNARLGDVYFIGEEQLNGQLSSPRFDEQGLAGTLYALASGQSCRFGSQVIPMTSLGLPKEFAITLQRMLSDDIKIRHQAGDYFINNMKYMKNIVVPTQPPSEQPSQLPVWIHQTSDPLESVVYTSRKSFLKEEAHLHDFDDIDDAQLDNYYKNFLTGMGDNSKAFLAAVSRLGKFPIVGGLAIHWQDDGLYIDSNLNLYDQSLKTSFNSAVNNMVTLARAIDRQGIFKACFFNARQTKHIARADATSPYYPSPDETLAFEIHDRPQIGDASRLHSYFEDEKDPDELLELPDQMMEVLAQINLIHHTGCIIFEALATDLKIHNYLSLLDATQQQHFQQLIDKLISLVPLIKGSGVSGFMKFPYKDSKFFTSQATMRDNFLSSNPKTTQNVATVTKRP